MIAASKFGSQHQRRTQTGSSSSAVKRAAWSAAILMGLGSSALATNQYWDINGTATGAGGATPSGTWDGVNTFWNSDATGGAAGTLSGDVGAGNTGIFAAGSDATGAYTVTIPTSETRVAGGLSVLQGTVSIAGAGNAVPIDPTTASMISVGSTTFNIDIASGATLHWGVPFQLPNFSGSADIVKIGAGYFNNIGLASISRDENNPAFTGRFIVNAGTMGIFFGQTNLMLGNPATFRADQLIINNNSTIKTLQNNNSVSFGNNQGVTIGSGGATFFFAGIKDYDPSSAITTLGSIQFTTRLTGGSEGARVPITVKSNVFNFTGTGAGASQGCTAFNFQDNASSTNAPPLYAKWIIRGGEVVPIVSGTDNGFGAVPATFLADAVTLDKDGTNADPRVGGANIRVNANFTIPANRGITLGSGGGGIRPTAAFTATVSSAISGPGQLRIFVEQNANAKVILTGNNSYTGGTWITGAAGATAQGSLEGTTNGLQGAIINESKLIFDQTFTGSYAGSISGAGTLTKNNTGTVYFTGSNSYTGATTVNGGILVANSTASLPGYNIAGKVTANSGGAVGVSAGGAGQWSVTDIDTLRSVSTFNNGSSVAFNVDATNSFTYPTNITPANSVGLIKLGAGTLTLSGNNTYAGATVVNGGTLVLTNTFRTSASLNVANGAKAAMTARSGSPNLAASRKTLQVGTLNLNSSGTLDLANNDLVVNSGSYTAIKALVFAGFGNPSGPGITSSTSDGSQILALFDNAVAGASDWNGGTIGPNAVVGKYTYFGDVNFDGQVTGDDYTVVDANLNTTPPVGLEWLSGDANLDGSVTGDDYTTIDANLNLGTGNPLSASALSSVPEPGLGWIAMASLGLCARSRKRK